MGFQKGAGQGVGFCFGCLVMAVAIPVLGLGGIGSWLSGIGTSKPTRAPTQRVVVSATPRPAAPATPRPTAPAWRDDFCAALDVTIASQGSSDVLAQALTGGSVEAVRSAGKGLKADGRSVLRAWLSLPEGRQYRDVRTAGLAIGDDLLEMGAMVLYAADHPGEADANGRRMVAQAKRLNGHLIDSTTALHSFNLDNPGFCDPSP